jgi:uncharacterized protein YndB with AHSA1/START domain
MKSHITAKVSETINASTHKVWEALTDPELIKKYFFGTNAITDWQVGNPIVFEGEYEGKKYHDKGTILIYREKELLRYTYWSSMSGIEDKPENYVTISYRLKGDYNSTTLTVTQENIPDEKTKAHSIENWKKVLIGLKEMVEKRHLVLK